MRRWLCQVRCSHGSCLLVRSLCSSMLGRAPTRRPRRGRATYRPPPLPLRDSLGMAIPEARLQRAHTSYQQFDRDIETGASDILGLADDEHSNDRNSPWGGAFDRRRIGFQGHGADVRRLAELPAVPVIVHGDNKRCRTAHLSTSFEGSHDDTSGNASEDARDGATHYRTRCSMRSYTSSVPASQPSRAYVRHNTTQPDPRASPDAETQSQPSVELDDGEVLPVREGHAALRRVLGSPGASALRTASLLSDDSQKNLPTQAPSVSHEARRRQRSRSRRELLQRRQEQQSSLLCHPCKLQGGCSGTGGGSPRAHRVDSLCPYAHYPVVYCVVYLRSGRCALAEHCLCPWRHEDPASISATDLQEDEVLLDSHDEEVSGQSPLTRRMKREHSAIHLGRLLQVVVDLVTVAMELKGCSNEMFAEGGSESSAARRKFVVEALSSRSHADAGECNTASYLQAKVIDPVTLQVQLSIDMEFAVSALLETMGHNDCMDSGSEHEASDYEPEAEVDEELTRLLRPDLMSTVHLAGDCAEDEGLGTHNKGEDVLKSVCRDWNSFCFLGQVPTNGARTEDTTGLAEGNLRRVWLTPLLTDWIVAKAVMQLAQDEGAVTTSERATRGSLFVDASETLFDTLLSHVPGEGDLLRACGKSWSSFVGHVPLLLLKYSLLLSSVHMVDLGASVGKSSLLFACIHRRSLRTLGKGPHSPAISTPSVRQLSVELAATFDMLHTCLVSPFAALLRTAPVELASFLQPALIALVSRSSTYIGEAYEHQMLSAMGWRPWSDEQIFSPSHAAAYTAQGFARHHMHLVTPSCMSALLNELLLATLQEAASRHGIDGSGVVEGVLDGPQDRKWRQERPAEWLQVQRRHRHHAMAHLLQPYGRVALGFLSALQDLSQRTLGLIQRLEQDFEARRAAYERERNSMAFQRDHRVRKYNVNDEAQRQRLLSAAEKQVPLLDRLMPVGSIGVNPSATALLLRQLLEGGSPYKALKLAASIVHASRVLRHAAKQPLPRLVQKEKVVHRRVTNARTQRKQIIKVKVPVLSLVTSDAMASERGTNSDENEPLLGRKTIRPVGLVYPLSEGVVTEIVRVGLRMGRAGLKLADGVRDDCFSQGLIDFSRGRCLPMGVSTKERSHIMSRGAALVEGLLAQIGMAAHSLSAFPTHAVAHPSFRRPIPPSPLFLAVLASHTLPTDDTRQCRLQRYAQEDLPRFATPYYLFARQANAMQTHSKRALQAVLLVWVRALAPDGVVASLLLAARERGGSSVFDAAFVRQLQKEAEDRKALVDEVWQVIRESRHRGGGVSPTRNPVTPAQVKALLAGEYPSDAKSGTPRGSQGDHMYPHELFLYLGCTDAQSDTRGQLHALWVVCAASIASLTSDVLNRTSSLSHIAADSLRMAFIAAVLSSSVSESHATVENTVRALLLSPLLQESSYCPNHEPNGKQSSTPTSLNLLSSHTTPVVRALPLFLGLQYALWCRLQKQISSEVAGTPWWNSIQHEMTVTLQPLLIQVQHTEEHTAAPAWKLLEGLLREPRLAVHWLQKTLTQPSASFMVWLTGHIQDDDLTAHHLLSQWLPCIGTAHISDETRTLLQRTAQRPRIRSKRSGRSDRP